MQKEPQWQAVVLQRLLRRSGSHANHENRDMSHGPKLRGTFSIAKRCAHFEKEPNESTHLEIRVVNMLEDQCRGPRLGRQNRERLDSLRSTEQYQTANGTLTTGSLTTACNVTMLGPPRRFSKILISRLIFFFLTGCTAEGQH